MTFCERRLFGDDSLAAFDVRCSCAAGERGEELTPGFEVVFPLAGAFERRARGGTALVDAAFGYVAQPHAPQEITHLTEGDRCLLVTPTPVLADELGLDRRAASWLVPVDRSAQRRLARALVTTTTGDELVAGEAWLHGLSRLAAPASLPRARGRAAQREAAVARVREAVAVDPGAPWTVRSLGSLAGYAPHHLSRVFSASTGMTLSDYRNRVRLGRAIVLLREGMAPVDVAATLGYADQAHLTRRATETLGLSPSAFRPGHRAPMSKRSP